MKLKMDYQNGFLGMKRDVIIRLMCYVNYSVILGMCNEIFVWRNHPYMKDFPIGVSINTFLKIMR
jgi:hypothetical protein